MNTPKLASFENFKDLGACPEDLYREINEFSLFSVKI